MFGKKKRIAELEAENNRLRANYINEMTARKVAESNRINSLITSELHNTYRPHRRTQANRIEVMPKPQSWYTSLNQPPRSPKDGRNRRANTTSHSRPTDGADTGGDTGGITFVAFTPGQVTYPFVPKPPTIPYAGVRAGELIGHRMWVVLPDLRLCSLAHRFIWEPNATIEGDVDKLVNSSIWSFMDPRWGGTYSYSTYHELAKELTSIEETELPYWGLLGNASVNIQAVAIGTIKCWGEVVEHERGYRAQYAKLHTLDRVIGPVDLITLRHRYLPNGQ